MSLLRLLLVLGLLVAVPAHAGERFLDLARAGQSVIPVNGPDCAGGYALDDGGYEGAVGWTNSTLDGRYTMRFPIDRVSRLQAVCLCLTRTEFSNNDSLDLEIQIYTDGGTSEPPGELVYSLPVRADEVPRFDQQGARYYRFELPEAIASAVHGPVHLGVAWVPNTYRQFFLCNDAGPDTPLQAGWSSGDGAMQWQTIVDLRPTFRALALRMELAPLPAPIAIPGDRGQWLLLLAILALGCWRLRY